MRFCTTRTLTTFVLFSGALASPLAAQRVLDWPLHTTAGPEAVMRGAEAAFWNIAGIAPRSGRGEVMIADQRTPNASSISGFAAAGSWRLDNRTTLGAAYQHVGIDDIGETSTTPLPDAEQPTTSIGEDQFTLGLSHALGEAVTAGAGFKYDRTNAGSFLPADQAQASDFKENTTTLEAGFLARAPHLFHPTVGGTVSTQGGGVNYAGGLEAGTTVHSVDVTLGYGLRGGEDFRVIEHRIGITGSWRQIIAATAGLVTAKAGSERSWEPVAGASLRVSRYEIGFLREMLSNDFGAAYSFRFRIGLE